MHLKSIKHESVSVNFTRDNLQRRYKNFKDKYFLSAPDILGYAKQSYEQKLQDLSGKQKLFRRISNDA